MISASSDVGFGKRAYDSRQTVFDTCHQSTAATITVSTLYMVTIYSSFVL